MAGPRIEFDKLTLPELIELMKMVAEEIEIRTMELIEE